MLHHLLEEYIPARSYVEYLKEIDAEFADFETAAILHQLGLPTETERAVYRNLLAETKDEELRRQLSEELAQIERTEELFQAGGAGFAYITCERSVQEDMIGIAANYETALALGIHGGADFRIKKYRLLTEYPCRPASRKVYLNPNLSESGDWRDCAKSYEDGSYSQELGRFTFRKINY